MSRNREFPIGSALEERHLGDSLRNSFMEFMGNWTQSFSSGEDSSSVWGYVDPNTSSDWDEGVSIIESILKPESGTNLSDAQREGLRKVQFLLLSGQAMKEAHVPRGLLQAAHEPGSTSDYILSAFAGLARSSAKQKVLKVITAKRFLHRLQLQKNSSCRMKIADKEAFVLPEWVQLNLGEQRMLTDRLSWKSLNRWKFDVFEIDRLTHGQPLLFISWAILASPYSQFVMQQTLFMADGEEGDPITLDDMPGYGFPDEFKIPQEHLINFLREVESQYPRNNPYHNDVHAADVVQTFHSMLQGMNLKRLASAPIELLALLLSAVVHDMGHPGKNNSFQTNSYSDLAIVYNDHSVLESLHCSLAFRLLLGSQKRPEMDIFAGMSDEQISSVRKMVIEAILATDMTHHFANVNKIKGIWLTYTRELRGSIHGGSAHGGGIHERSMHGSHSSSAANIQFKREDAWQLLHFAMHLADISNPAKPINISARWTDRCLEEFFEQGDEEKRLGLPVSPLCDRETTQRADSQIGFIKFVVAPAYDIFGKIVPEMKKIILPILDANLSYWSDRKIEDDAKALLLEGSDGEQEGESNR